MFSVISCSQLNKINIDVYAEFYPEVHEFDLSDFRWTYSVTLGYYFIYNHDIFGILINYYNLTIVWWVISDGMRYVHVL